MIWLNNVKDTLTPWKGGSGGYAKFVVHSADSITEKTSNGTGSGCLQLKTTKIHLNVPYWTIDLQTDINKIIILKNGEIIQNMQNFGEEWTNFKKKQNWMEHGKEFMK